jgi:hypothetical protein
MLANNITRPSILYIKVVLLLLLGVMSAALVVVASPRLSTAVLLAIAIWGFARVYYFAFYVIEHYIDPAYRFSGLWSCLVYLRRRRETAAREGRTG